MSFDVNSAPGANSGIFGLPYTQEESRLILVPVPWEATVSYRTGTVQGPEMILEASRQVDLYDLETKKAYESGYYLLPISEQIKTYNNEARKLATPVIKNGGPNEALIKNCEAVNGLSEKVNQWLYESIQKQLQKKKLVGVIGGDHSTPFGAIQAIGEQHQGNYGILHIDAHADLRKAYEGFTHSHASIMYNVMHANFKPQKLVQVGIRDFCEEEYELIQSRKDIQTFFDLELKEAELRGTTWAQTCESIVKELPQKVYISFDIDGLDPSYCPGTGTPVPGGLNFAQTLLLFKTLAEHKKTIVGFDLNEVGGGPTNDEWNGIVGARILYKLCGWSIITNR